MKAFLIVLALLVLLGFLKVGVCLVYDGTVKVRLLIGKIRMSFPSEKKPRKKAKPKPEKPKAKQTPEAEQKPKSSARGWTRAALAHWQDILALVGKALHMPRLNPLVIHVTAGGSDAAERALNYGRAWAILGGALPVLENAFRIGRREIDVQCGENQEKFTFYIRTELTVRIYEILLLAVLGLKLLIQIYQSSEKAVQTT